LSATEWSGRKVSCPACHAQITIPEPAREAKKPAPAMAFSPATHPNFASQAKRIGWPATGTKASVTTVSTKTAPPLQPTTVGQNAKAKASSAVSPRPPQLRIAVLTEEIKLELVRAVRRRIAKPADWLPDGFNGAYAYAAKVCKGETVLVDVKSPDATRFSLIGAFLLEFHLRQVVRTAIGREKLLDQEIPDAIHEVLTTNVNSEERERIEHTSARENLINLLHPQCLATLEVLEQRYLHRMDFARAELAKEFLSSIRLPDLVKKLEKKSHVTSEEVATALYLELLDVRRRLDRLESGARGANKVSGSGKAS